MATYRRFEDLPVWNKAADLAATIFEFTAIPEFRGKGDLANQLQRATLSISNNVAEGFERGTTKELLQFLYIARGSCGECRSMLAVMDRMDAFGNFNSEISNLKSDFENVSRQLGGWASSLQNSDIEGPRHLNDKTREHYQRKHRQKAHVQRQEELKAEREAKWKREREARNQQGPES